MTMFHAQSFSYINIEQIMTISYVQKPAIAAMHGPHSLVRFGD